MSSTPLSMRGNFKMALASVRANKWRSFLTMLGIIIGVVSVIMVVSIGQGVKNQVNRQISQLGSDLITVRPGNNNGSVSLFQGTNPENLGVLTNDDLNQVQRVRGVRMAVPLSQVSGNVTINKQQNSTPVLATTDQLPQVIGNDLAYGDFFSSDTSTTPNVAVVGSNVAKQLFQRRIPLGESFDFLGQTFYVRGVFKQFDTPPSGVSLTTDFNNAIFIPQSTAQSLTNNNAQIYKILAKPVDANQTNAVAAGISEALRSAHQGQQQFSVLQQSDSLEATNHILDVITRMIAGIAAISLLVGGIGIMNVMLVSVTERLHEIGIRKALGATNRQILNQFMAEAIVLSTLGGLIGVVTCFIIGFILRSFTNIVPAINWPITLIALLVSILVGIIFGTAPALKAAQKDPIQALRNE